MKNRMLSALTLAALAVPLGLASSTTLAQTQPVGQGYDQQPVPAVKPLPTTDVTPIPEEAARRPLMLGLDYLGVAKGLDALGLNIYGHVQGGYTYSTSSPPGDFITGRVYDIDNDEFVLNQLDLTFERLVDISKLDGKFDFGGKFEFVFGSDSRINHSNGLNFYGGNNPQLDPENQADIVQAYLDFGVPLGNGLNVRVGKFVTLLGNETINPTTNLFYSRTYQFGFASPFTHTGVLGTYKINDHFAVDAGITRGWDQALKDNNGVPDFLGRLTWTIDDRTTAYFATSLGPNGTDDNSGWWYVFNGIVNHKLTDEVTLTLDTNYAFYDNGTQTTEDIQWYGAIGYVSYAINKYVSANLRGEFFDDQDGYRFGTDRGNKLYAASLGLNVRPFPDDVLGKNVLFRPEVRYDYSDKAFFDAGTDHSQFTVAFDVLVTF